MRKYLPLFAYGVGMEVLQHFIPNRHFGVDDILADGAGILLYGILLLPLLRRWQIR
jgi:VanZ family protein